MLTQLEKKDNYVHCLKNKVKLLRENLLDFFLNISECLIVSTKQALGFASCLKPSCRDIKYTAL
jgi:hypothetical protein